MFDWINENREWLFSGVGVALVTTIATIVAVNLRRNRAAKPGHKQVSGPGSVNIQVEGDASGEINVSIHDTDRPENRSLRIATDDEVDMYDPARRELVARIRTSRTALSWLYFPRMHLLRRRRRSSWIIGVTATTVVASAGVLLWYFLG